MTDHNKTNCLSTRFKNVNEKFLQMEEDLNLFDKKIDGVYFWERINIKVCQEIFESLGIFGQSHSMVERTLFNKILFSLRSLHAFLFKNPFFSKSSKIVFFVRSRRKLFEDGKWWDIYCDPIINYLPKSDYIFLEHPYMFKHFRPSKTENLKYLDILLFIAALRRELGLIKIKFNEEELNFLKLVERKIKEIFNINIELKEIVHQNLQERKSEFDIYESLFKKLNPRIVLLGQSYGWETIIEICKKLNIPTVELQHGIIDKYNFGYSFPGIKRKKRTFPDYFFAFGDFWKNCVEFPIRKEHIFSVGYPYLEEEKARYCNIKKRNRILFISGGGIGKEVSKFAVELSKYKNLDYDIIYKLHPGEYHRWKREYPWLDKANKENSIKVVENDNPPFYKLMAESKIQIGVNSTAIYEGLNFGLDTYLLDLPGIEYMDHLIERGNATVIYSVKEFVGYLALPRKNNGKKVNIDYFFKPDALENIIHKINELSL